MDASAVERGGVWAPLGAPRFRVAWAAFLFAQLVVWAQTVGAVEVITAQTGSAAAVAGIQAAISLPAVALVLHAGAAADVADKRLLLVGACGSMAIATGSLAILTTLGSAAPAVVLALTAALGAGLTVFLPAFWASVPELVPRSLLAGALTLTGGSINLARAIGPAFAAGLIVMLGASGLFWLLAALLAAVTVSLVAFGPASARPHRPERIGAAMRSGLRYARYSAPLRVVVARSLLFTIAASALWAMLPLIAVYRLGIGASGFGILLGCIGTGAVLAAANLGRVQHTTTLDGLIAVSTALVAASLASLAFVTNAIATGAILLVAGAAWTSIMTSFNRATHIVSAPWVRGRSIALWLLATQVGMGVGSLLWGAVAEMSLQMSLLLAAGLLLVGMTGALWARLPAGEEDRVEVAPPWRAPVAAVAPVDDAGPVLVTVDYDVVPDRQPAFVEAMFALAVVRRRDGARRWHLFEDVARPGRFVETFTATSWVDHLRQHERGEQDDLRLEESVRSLARSVSARHLVGVRAGAERDGEQMDDG